MWVLALEPFDQRDRKSVVKGKSVRSCVDLGGCRIIKKKIEVAPLSRKASLSVTNTPSCRRTSSLCSPISGARVAGTLSTPCFFIFKQKTAYELRPCDWSSDVCSSDLGHVGVDLADVRAKGGGERHGGRV